MEKPLPADHDYVYSVYEVCEILGKTARTISRYVRRGILHPAGIKSCQGTLEYRFSKAEVEAVREQDSLFQRFIFPPNLYAAPGPGRAAFASVDYRQPPATQPAPYFTPAIPHYAEPAGVRQQPAPARAEKPMAQDQTVAEEGAAVNVSQDSALSQNRDNEQIIVLLKETTGMLRDQLKVKDDQIKNLDDKIGQLIERNRETNILLKGLQDKMVLLEKPKNERKTPAKTETAPGPAKENLLKTFAEPAIVQNPRDPIKIKISERAAADIQRVAPGASEMPAAPIQSTAPVAPSISDAVAKPAEGGFLGKFFRGGQSR